MAEAGEPSAKRCRTLLAQESPTELCKETKNSSSKGNDEPPQLSINVPSRVDIQTITKPAPILPVDVLLLTVKDCEFLACYQKLNDAHRCWFDGLGYVYFGEVTSESQQERVKAALLRCYRNGIGPGGSLISVTKAVRELRPKAVISVGTCSSLNPNKCKLGDVVVSAKLTTYASKVVTSDQEQSTGMRSYVSKRFLDVIKNCDDGWQAPLKNPEAYEVTVHRDSEILSGPEQVSAEYRRKQLAKDHPHATAIEMEGEGIFTAAFDCQIEWLIVKGIADYADGAQMTEESWSPCASVMAASLVAHILSDSAVFHSWPHYEDLSEQSLIAGKSKEDLPVPGDSAATFLEWSQNQLCSFYNSNASKVMITPWDVDNTMDIDEVYVQLSFLRDDRKLAGTTKEKLEDYSEIFVGSEHDLVPKRILVYGRPGIGKSTFTKKLAVDWSRGKKEILKKFSVLLLIKLRDICNTQDLCAMLQKAELLSGDDPMVFNQLYKYILENQQKVLLVLDGFDEYGGEKSSQVHQIWRGSKLRDCTVLVTSRPFKEAELRPPSHAQFEINGFNHKQIRKFALKFLLNQGDVNEFTDFLFKHKLWDMAKIPLLLLMLCLTWNEKNRQELLHVTSRAHLYESFFQTLFDHVAAKTSDSEFRSIDEYKEDLSKLGKLAFDALLTDCLYFKLSKLPEVICLLIKKYIAVGFLQVSKLLSSPRPEEIVYFLHKTIQEFLSAWFIVQELRNAKEKTPTCLSKVDSFEKIRKVTEVLKFVCELSSEAASAVFSHLKMIGEKEHLTENNFTEYPYIEDLSYAKKLFYNFSLDCFLSCPTSERQVVYPSLLQCVNSVLVINSSQLEIVAREHLLRSTLPKPDYLFLNTDFANFLQMDENLLAMMQDLETVMVTCHGDTEPISKNSVTDVLCRDKFFLKNEGQQMVFYLTKIKNSCADKFWQAIKTLLHELVSEPESPPQNLVDHVSQDKDASSSLALSEKTSDQTLKHSLSFVKEIEITYPRSEELMIVKNVLPFVRRPQAVQIEGNNFQERPLDAQFVESLVSYISFTDSLVKLILIDINLTAKCAAVIARSLHQAPNLNELNLSHNPMGNAVHALLENLHHTAHFDRLRLTDVHIEDQECWLPATSFEHLERINVLDLSENPLSHGIVELGKHLHTVPKLTKLYLKGTQMGEEEVKAVARRLHNVNLKKLVLSHNPLSHGIIELVRHLQTVPQLTELYLDNTQMGEEEVKAVAHGLHYVNLEKLVLSHNPLSHGIIELGRHLQTVPKLTELYLDNTQMGEEEVKAVAHGLHYVNLEKLVLSHNPLSHGIIELVRHLHRMPQLTELYLDDTLMGEEEVIAVAHGLHNVHLKKLVLSHNPLSHGIIELVRHLHRMPQLTKLYLDDTLMGEEEVIAVAHGLHNVNLKKLVLSHNPLSRGIIELGRHLCSVHKLTELDLGDTQMGEEEVKAVARSLHNVNLKKLVLSHNPLSHGIIELGRDLYSVHKLTELDLGDTQMGEEEVKAVARGLHNVNLKKLVLSHNPLSHGIIELGRHLHSVPQLTELDLEDTQMGEEEAIAVTHALKHVPKLKNLNLSHNPLGRGVSELIQCLSSIPQLNNLWLKGVQITKKETSDLCTALYSRKIRLWTY